MICVRGEGETERSGNRRGEVTMGGQGEGKGNYHNEGCSI